MTIDELQNLVGTQDARIADLEYKLRQLVPQPTQIETFPDFPGEYRIPMAQSFQTITATQKVGVTHAVLRWLKPPDPQIERFEIWSKRLTDNTDQWQKLDDFYDSPATVQVTANQDTSVVLGIVTVLKNGRRSDINVSPTVALDITLNPITGADIAAGSIGDSHFDRVSGDKIQVLSADIVSLNAAQINAGTLNAGVILASNIAATQVSAGTLNAGVILASNIAATQINAGTLAAGVILASNINATQINAGTMTAVNVSAGTFTLTSGINVMKINGTDGIYNENTSTSSKAYLKAGYLQVEVGSLHTTVTQPGLSIFNGSALSASVLNYTVSVNNTSGAARATLGTLGTGNNEARLVIYNSSGNDVARLSAGTSTGYHLGQSHSGYLGLLNSGATSKTVEAGTDSGGIGGIKFDASSSNWAMRAAANGKKVVGGNSTTGTTPNTVTVNTGLSSVDAFVVTHITGGSPGVIFSHQTPSGANVTVESDTGGAAFSWIAIGDT